MSPAPTFACWVSKLGLMRHSTARTSAVAMFDKMHARVAYILAQQRSAQALGRTRRTQRQRWQSQAVGKRLSPNSTCICLQPRSCAHVPARPTQRQHISGPCLYPKCIRRPHTKTRHNSANLEVALYRSRISATPKSESLRTWSLVRSRLLGLMSRCTTD